MLTYTLIIVGQKLFQRHVEILSRREACQQQEVVDLSRVNAADIGKYEVVNVEPSAPPEDSLDDSESLFGVCDGSNVPMLH
jgi:hypothetical protein